jgi:hypothetical protein
MRKKLGALVVMSVIFAGALFAVGGAASPPAKAGRAIPPNLSRYSLVHGCYSVRTASGQVLGPFRMQAATLGQYLLYRGPGNFLGAGLKPESSPSNSTVWVVEGHFTITNLATGEHLAVSFRPASGCAVYPEADVDASGRPFAGASPESQVNGTIDAHTHVTAFEFLGGDWHCGRPWHAFGIPFALPDCAPYEQGSNGQVESFIDYGEPFHQHDTRGWPTFRDWPLPTDLAEEGDYYTGIKRAWMAGLRVMVTQLVDNEALCTLMTTRRNPCDDMAAVRLQAKDLRALQDYIDAQSGGPGQGFFRIVTNPFQARQVINSGRLAVVEGIEVSDLFHCGEFLGTPKCDRAQIDAGLNEVRGLGVSTFFPVHKFDNAFGGAKMDGGEIGLLVNGGNQLETGHFFNVQTCTGPEHDNTQLTVLPPGALSQILSGVGATMMPGGVLPVYPAPPHCNTRGLTDLGAYLISKMIQQHFLVELDHMDAKTADAALGILEAHHYSGVVSAHSWDSPEENPRIYRLGGFMTPIAGASPQSFISQWQTSRQIRDPRFYSGLGFGYGADMNGLAEESQPTSGHPIAYPFKSYDGAVTFTREQWGQRVFDLNRDGVANYGMFPDWLQELQTLAGRPILTDMFHGAEAYLEMWERAYGVPASACRPFYGTLGGQGAGSLRLGAGVQSVLYAAGQPAARPGRAFRYCVTGSSSSLADVVFRGSGRAGLIATTAPAYRAGTLQVGHRVGGRPGVRLGTLHHGGWRYVYRVRARRITFVGVAARGTRRQVLSDVRASGF